MPNYIDNCLTVFGEPDAVDAFVKSARGKHPPSGTQSEWENSEKPFSFHALVPLPPEYSTVSYGDGLPSRGFEMECDTWGIKWGAFVPNRWPRDLNEMPPVELDPGMATYCFGTTWNAPWKVFMPKVAVKFPALQFFLSWGGEGPTRGRAWYHGNSHVSRPEGYNKADYPERGDDEETWNRDQYLTRELRLHTHALWVGWRVAVMLGKQFSLETPWWIVADFVQEHGYVNLANTLRSYDSTDTIGPNPGA
jgi:hypothetical protein